VPRTVAGPHRAFDDFRRDFASAPLAWRIDAGNARDSLAAAIRRHAVAAGDVVVEDVSALAGETPHLWFPAVYFAVAARPEDAPAAPPAWPRDTLKVLVLCDGSTRTEDRVGAWDVIVGPTVDPGGLFGRLAALARSRHVESIAAENDTPPAPTCKVSVVVCTYRRPAALARALDSLAGQEFAAEDHEVLVVNNDVADTRVAEVVWAARRTGFASRPARLRLVQCPFPGLSFARNAGIAQACGEVVAFLDDDAVASPNWLKETWRAFREHPDAGVVGGRINLRVPEPRPRWAKPGWEKYWSAQATELRAVTTVDHWWQYPWGANWSARRQVLVAMGGFRTRYGRRGSDAAGGEEIVAAALAHELGHGVVIAPAAEVLHMPDDARFTLGHVWRRIHAAKREEYRQQREGYIPGEMTFRSAARDLGRHLRRASVARGLAPHERLEHLMYACAEARVLVPLLSDRWLQRS
jgi:GT2 family glycosyltransferase